MAAFMNRNLYHVIFNLFALFALIYIGVDIFYRALCFHLTEMSSIEMAEVAVPDRVQHRRPPLKSFDGIVERNIFGSVATASKEAKARDTIKEDLETLDPTSLKITLLGTVTGTEENSWAVIEEARGKNQGLYRVGDTIQNAVIQRIVWGKVVLRVGDKDEILLMEEPVSQKGGGSERSVKPGSSGDTVTVARSDIQKSMQNINKLLTQARIRPHLKDGKADGFVLSYIKEKSFFTQLGLKRGDIIKSINGKAINTPEDAFSFYKALESGSPLAMEIIRGGQPKIINYQFK